MSTERSKTVIRPPRPEELDAFHQVDVLTLPMWAGGGFIDIDSYHHEPRSYFVKYLYMERAWLLLVEDTVAGYALVDIVDGLAHLEQISIIPQMGRQGHGTALLEYVCEWARSCGYAAITLTTFRNVPWNFPFYEHRGFATIEPDHIGPELRQVQTSDERRGLDPAKRVCMIKLLYKHYTMV